MGKPNRMFKLYMKVYKQDKRKIRRKHRKVARSLNKWGDRGSLVVGAIDWHLKQARNN